MSLTCKFVTRICDQDCTVTQECCFSQVNLEVPQEVRMWEDFTDCSRVVSQGGSLNAHWPNIAMLTQKVICAVEQSALNGCRTQKIQW